MAYRQARWNEKLLVELGRKGRVGFVPPSPIEPGAQVDLPKELLRDEVKLPGLSELQVVRHFVRLSQMNFCVDTGFYPLGSCTMKYNPKLNDKVASNPKVTDAHPYQPTNTVQGLMGILYELSTMLARITGMDYATTLPAAGAHGELLGALMIRRYHEVRGDRKRNEMIVPDSAHGTNPASAQMAGFKVVKVSSDSRGLVDVAELKKLLGERTAGIMMTVPNTLGLFEKDVMEISKLVHGAGGLMYYDGANLNAIIGRVRPGDLGFDVVHLNIHKTFSTPHGGGGPGAGPLCVKGFLHDYLPTPLLSYDGSSYQWLHELPHSVGGVKSFWGNVGVLVRAYAYLLTLGSDGLKEVSGLAVLASNYLMKKLDPAYYSLPYAEGVPRKHEFVVSSKPLAKTGVKALNVAKAIIDEGQHAPTVYFPLIVDEALMVEPTETEPVEEIDLYAETLNSIGRRALADPEDILKRPLNTASGQLDDFKASHPMSLKLKWNSGGA
ncbi:MAG TPA: aminomethyl-transferring glycine dehydrogenase subunit GcvPB [Conexivisphaerales archaeon]|nr:aminomethyl-transferring glycine dehydrogenase subunit GcvPB [Conexivisphaerales archaeon]